MTVFISHSLEYRSDFDNIADALNSAHVPYWNPAEVKAGTLLRDQLRDAVRQCSVCIFVATHRSLQSNWCGTELGAFWGAGKPIIVYLADSSLGDEQLPPIVQGDVWERRIARVVSRAKELVTQGVSTDGNTGRIGSSPVGNMTIEELEKLIVGAVSLGAAQGKAEIRKVTPEAIGRAAKGAAGRVLEGIRTAERTVLSSGETWRRRILWVDDRPSNNVYEREALEAMGLSFTMAKTTQEALDLLWSERFAVVISDMGRREGPKEGYVLLQALRAKDAQTPFLIYAGSNAPEHRLEAAQRGAQGVTDRPDELFEMVVRALPDGGAD
jgi:CheY-like chemotaxis protein